MKYLMFISIAGIALGGALAERVQPVIPRERLDPVRQYDAQKSALEQMRGLPNVGAYIGGYQFRTTAHGTVQMFYPADGWATIYACEEMKHPSENCQR